MVRRKFIWLKVRFCVGLFLYWFFSLSGASIFRMKEFKQGSSDSGFVILFMILVVSVLMYFERGEWSRWKRVGLDLPRKNGHLSLE
jgi:hypothetical protein